MAIPPEVIIHPTCAFHTKGATRSLCEQRTKVLQHNKSGCCRIACASRLRRCYACVSMGMYESLSTDPKTGLCSFHTEHGAGTRPARPPLQTARPDRFDRQPRTTPMVAAPTTRPVPAPPVITVTPKPVMPAKAVSGPVVPRIMPTRVAGSIKNKGYTGRRHQKSTGISLKDPQDPNKTIRLPVYALLQLLIDLRDNEKLSQSDISKKLGMHIVSVNVYLRLERLIPEVRQMLKAEPGLAPPLPQIFALEIALFKGEFQENLARKAVQGAITLKDLKQLKQQKDLMAPKTRRSAAKQSATATPSVKKAPVKQHINRMRKASKTICASADMLVKSHGHLAQAALSDEQRGSIATEHASLRKRLARLLVEIEE